MALVMAPEAGPLEPAQPIGLVSPAHPPLVAWLPLLGTPFPSPSQYGFYFCGFNKNFTSSSALVGGGSVLGLGLFLQLSHQAMVGPAGVGRSSWTIPDVVSLR